MADQLGTKEAPFTHDHPKRGYMMCKCGACGIVAQCTPSFDFYTKTDEKTGLLYCERCTMHGPYKGSPQTVS